LGIVLDYDADNRIVGMEVLNASDNWRLGRFPSPPNRLCG